MNIARAVEKFCVINPLSKLEDLEISDFQPENTEAAGRNNDDGSNDEL